MSVRRIDLAIIKRQQEGTYAPNRDEELLAMIKVVEAALVVEYVFVCRCDEAWTGRGLHAPDCVAVDGVDLISALAPFRQERR